MHNSETYLSEEISHPHVRGRQSFLQRIRQHRSFVIFLGGVCAVGVGIVILGGLSVYVFAWDHVFIQNVSRVVPYPAAFVSRRVIWYKDFQAQVDTLSRYYAQQERLDLPDLALPSSENVRKTAMDRLVKTRLTEILAQTLGVTVTSAEIEVEFTTYAVPQSENLETLIKNLSELYGWTLDDFKYFIIREVLLREKIMHVLISQSDFDVENLKQAEEIYKLVMSGQKSFEDIAKDLSEDTFTAALGGDLGIFRLADMDPVFSAAVASLEKGQVSSLVHTQYGFHIIQLDDRIPAASGKSEETQYVAKHILVRGKTIDAVIAERLAQTQVRIWVPLDVK